MDAKIIEIYKKFKYDTTIPIPQIIEEATTKLGLYNNIIGESYIIITKSVEHIYTNIKRLGNDEYILTDCRFFAMLMCSLKEYPESGMGFMMHLSKNGLEIMIPKTCLYITLNTDMFVLNKESVENTIYIPEILGSDQGQWISQWEGNKYIGIVDEGAMIQELDYWVERYRTNVEKYIEINNNKTHSWNRVNTLKDSYDGILYSLSKIHGIDVCAYRFNNRLNDIPVVDILKEPSYL